MLKATLRPHILTLSSLGDGVSESEVKPRCRTVGNIRVANIWRSVLVQHFWLLCDLATGLSKTTAFGSWFYFQSSGEKKPALLGIQLEILSIIDSNSPIYG